MSEEGASALPRREGRSSRTEGGFLRRGLFSKGNRRWAASSEGGGGF